jgi:putative hydrolase
MELIAITDHGPSMIGTAGNVHFHMGKRAPKKEGKLQILWGIELNVIDAKGNIDIGDWEREGLDIQLLGFHGSTPYRDLGEVKNTLAFLKAMEHPGIDVISHPTNQQFPCDYKKIIRRAIEKGIILEFNLSYLKRRGDDSFDKFKFLVDETKKTGTKMIMSSDAHFKHEIGDDSALGTYWDKLRLKDELFWNDFKDDLLDKLLDERS